MPNKYSHALVLSSYERRGLTDFTDFERQRTTKSPSVRSTTLNDPVQSAKPTPRPIPKPLIPSPPRDRLRLRDSRDLLITNSQPPPRHISEYSLSKCEPPPQAAPQQSKAARRRTSIRKSVDYYDLYTPDSLTESSCEDAQSTPTQVVSSQKESRLDVVSVQSIASSTETSEISLDDPEWFQSMQRRRRRLTNDTAIWDPQPSSRPPSAQATQHVVDRKDLTRQHPLTPPLTPKARDSWESFSLDTHLDELPPPLPFQHPPRVVPRHFDMTPPDSVSSDSRLLPLTRSLSTTSASHSQVSSGRHKPSSSIPNRRSSLSSLQRPTPASLGHKEPDLLTFDNLSDISGPDSLDLDSDLEPLPPDLCNDPDFAAMPWTDYPEVPAISRLIRRNSCSSRASSFDSAAPPPISLGDRKKPNRRLPAILNEKEPKQLKKPRSSFSFLSAIGRATSTPKSIPYNSTSQGKAPVPVNVSRTNAPSIPSLFSSYRGPFPPNTPSRRPQTSGSSTGGKVDGSRTSTMNSSHSSGRNGGVMNTNDDAKLKRRSVRIAGEAFGFRPGIDKRTDSFGTDGIDRDVVSKGVKYNPTAPWAV